MVNCTMTTSPMRHTANMISFVRRPAKPLAAVAASITLALTSGCLYRMDIRQGNFLDPSQVIRLENGMTKSQVRFLLGTPQLPNGFDNDRWNYYYYDRPGRADKATTKRLTVWFKDDKVDHFERPPDTEERAAALAEADAKGQADQAAQSAAAQQASGSDPGNTHIKAPAKKR